MEAVPPATPHHTTPHHTTPHPKGTTNAIHPFAPSPSLTHSIHSDPSLHSETKPTHTPSYRCSIPFYSIPPSAHLTYLATLPLAILIMRASRCLHSGDANQRLRTVERRTRTLTAHITALARIGARHIRRRHIRLPPTELDTRRPILAANR